MQEQHAKYKVIFEKHLLWNLLLQLFIILLVFFLYKMHGRSQSTTQRGEKKNTRHWNSIDHVVSIKKKKSKQIFDFFFFPFPNLCVPG